MTTTDCTGPVPNFDQERQAARAAVAARQARLSAREHVTVRATGLTSPDPGQHARRALLYYLANGCPHPEGMPDHRDIPPIDLAVILAGLVDEPFEAKWDHAAHTAKALADVRDDGLQGTTAEAFYEQLLLDAVNTCAPDREATDGV